MKQYLLFCILFFSAFLQAQVYRLDSALNVRDDDKDFVSEDDVVGHVSAKTEFEIVSSKTLRSGAKALEVKILNKGKGSNLSNDYVKTGPVYIYQSKNTKFTKISNSTETEASVPYSKTECATCASDNKKDMEKQPAVTFAKDYIQAVEEKASEPKTSPSAAPASIQEQIKNYENSPEVAKTIKLAAARIKRLSGGGKCYKETKNSLVAGGLLKSKPSDKYARNAANTLSGLGFVNLLKEPYSLNYTPDTAPKGSVLVYESASKCDKYTKNIMGLGCGDTAIKLGDGSDTKGFKYASDYKSDKAITEGRTGSKYRLIGVMIKPNL